MSNSCFTRHVTASVSRRPVDKGVGENYYREGVLIYSDIIIFFTIIYLLTSHDFGNRKGDMIPRPTYITACRKNVISVRRPPYIVILTLLLLLYSLVVSRDIHAPQLPMPSAVLPRPFIRRTCETSLTVFTSLHWHVCAPNACRRAVGWGRRGHKKLLWLETIITDVIIIMVICRHNCGYATPHATGIAN
jgi:hypothetical protein